MIRLSKTDDREGLIALWQEAFGDSLEAVEMFLDKRYQPQNTVVCEENGKIASMLFLLEGNVLAKGRLLKAYYLYAAATLKEFRGKGIMSKMLCESKSLAESRGVDVICLKPAEESLYGFYAKHGYKSVFSVKRASFKCRRESVNIIENRCEDNASAREKALNCFDRFIWDNNAIDFAFEQHKYYGGKVLEDCNGYCLYSVGDGICTVKEYCFTHQKINEILSSICSLEQISEITVDLPVGFRIDADFSVMPNGMVLLISEESQFIAELNDLYLNLTLD